ncbi:MAG TPA: FtsX-like permease family protein [Hanamia sp.]|nr:FtsX-like permease family protein [Hanamia sp.]
MNSNVNLSIARVHLLSKKKQTIVAILGVTFGISMFILMVSFMLGTNEFLQDAMLSSTPDIHIYSKIKNTDISSVTEQYFRADNNRLVIVHHSKPPRSRKDLKNSSTIINNIKQNKNVDAVSPVLSAQVFFNYGPAQLNGIIEGVDINEETQILNISGKMVEGSPANLNKSQDGILMGERLAENLNIHMGEMVTVLTGSGTIERFHLVGIFQFGLGAVDNTTAIVNIANVQQLLGKGSDYITDIHVKLKDINNSKKLAVLFTNKYGYAADDWATANASILATVVARNVMTWVVSIALLVVAGFGIYNIMNMTIINKLKEIAILKAQGFNSKDVSVIFLSQSILIGFVGAVAGIILGFIFSYIISRLPFPKSDIVSLKYFPVIFELKYYVFGVVFGVLTTFIAGFIPSLKASKSDPLAILRNSN